MSKEKYGQRWVDLWIPHDEFTMDSIPSEIFMRKFDGEDLNAVFVFIDPSTGEKSHERSTSISFFAFNGTAILTPSAMNARSKLGVHNIRPDQLEGNMKILDLEK